MTIGSNVTIQISDGSEISLYLRAEGVLGVIVDGLHDLQFVHGIVRFDVNARQSHSQTTCWLKVSLGSFKTIYT